VLQDGQKSHARGHWPYFSRTENGERYDESHRAGRHEDAASKVDA
jgi:hypothetical protein